MDKKKDDATCSGIEDMDMERVPNAKAQEEWTTAVNEKRTELGRMKKK